MSCPLPCTWCEDTRHTHRGVARRRAAHLACSDVVQEESLQGHADHRPTASYSARLLVFVQGAQVLQSKSTTDCHRQRHGTGTSTVCGASLPEHILQAVNLHEERNAKRRLAFPPLPTNRCSLTWRQGSSTPWRQGPARGCWGGLS